MLFNVSTLLSEPVGSSRSFTLEDEPAVVPEEGYATAASGTVELMRTLRGVLVRARLTVRANVECARCLAPFGQELALEFDEEFVLERDPETGEPLEDIAPDDFRVDARQHLDVSEAVRQYEQSALPLRPVCRPDCAGLCPTCGQDLNQRACGCERDDADGRWSALTALAAQLRMEEDDGGAEAQDAEGEAATPA